MNNRLKHYLKRIELLAQTTNAKFPAELQELINKFKHTLAKGSFKEKSLLLDQHTKLPEFADYLALEFDKQYINEDLLIETWYLNEILPHLSKDLYDEVTNIIRDLKEAYRADDLEKKFNIYADVGENLSEKFLTYFYGEDEPMPLLNAQLKYYLEYLQYLLKECQVGGEFEKPLKDFVSKVEAALTSTEKAEKENVVEMFDDITTKFGRYLDEHFVDFKMYKFGE